MADLGLTEQTKARDGAANWFDCACDVNRLCVVRTYLKRHFPDRTGRDFHTRSIVKV